MSPSTRGHPRRSPLEPFSPAEARDTTFVRAHPHRFSSSDVLRIVTEAGFHVTHSETPGTLGSAIEPAFLRTCLLAQ